MSRPKEKGILAGLALAFGVLIFVALMLLGSVREQRKTAAWVAHARDVLEKINELVTDLSDAENGRRGYVLSGHDRYLGHHTNRVGHVETALRELRELTRDNPDQSAACDRLERMIRQRLTIFTSSIKARQENGLDVEAQIIFMEQGQQAMEPIRQLAAQMTTEETARLKEHRAIRDKNVKGTEGFAVLVSILGLGLFSVLLILFSSANRRRRRTEQVLEQTNLELERRVQHRTAELSQTVEKLEQADEFRGKVMESAVFGLGALNLEGRFTLANERFGQIVGYAPQELLGEPYSILLSAKNNASLRPEFLRVVREKQPLAYREIDVVRKDGSTASIVFSLSPLLTHGEVKGVVGTLLDITERKRAEEALHKSEAQLQTIVENLGEGVAVSDLDGQLLHFNRAALDLHGFASLDECRRHLTRFAETFELRGMDGTVLPVDRWPLARILRGEKLRDLEVRIRRIQADWQRVFSYGGTLVHDAGGQPLMAVVTISDITERKRAEEEIRCLNAELEQRVVARTAQLQAANGELEAFSYSVSHDLRAPIRHIASFAGMVRKRSGEKLDEKGRHYLSQVLDSAKEMGQLIDDLLSFSHMGRAAMQETVVDLEALVEETLRTLQPETQGRNIAWKRSRLPKARGDAAMLRQVFVNLLANAIKYTRSRDPAEIEIGCQDGNPNELVIFVRDNGVGFDMQYADKLFRVFQRLHRVEDFEGTGIGLANVRRIVARHGGRTWAEGAVNRGATFYLSLPNH